MQMHPTPDLLRPPLHLLPLHHHLLLLLHLHLQLNRATTTAAIPTTMDAVTLLGMTAITFTYTHNETAPLHVLDRHLHLHLHRHLLLHLLHHLRWTVVRVLVMELA
jgi:hypothetical protein